LSKKILFNDFQCPRFEDRRMRRRVSREIFLPKRVSHHSIRVAHGIGGSLLRTNLNTALLSRRFSFGGRPDWGLGCRVFASLYRLNLWEAVSDSQELIDRLILSAPKR